MTGECRSQKVQFSLRFHNTGSAVAGADWLAWYKYFGNNVVTESWTSIPIDSRSSCRLVNKESRENFPMSIV